MTTKNHDKSPIFWEYFLQMPIAKRLFVCYNDTNPNNLGKESLMLFLITGFNPFGNSALNASAEAVRALPTHWGDHEIVTATLPVVYDKCADVLYGLLDEYRPDVVLCLGQAVGREGVSLEHAAVNVKASSSPDNAGVTFSGEKIAENGADSLPSNLPLKELSYALKEVGITAKISYSAGTYVCNNLFYHLMHYASEHAKRMQCGFIHIPPCEEQKPDYAEGTPILPTAEAVRALKAIVAYLCA